MKADDRPNLLFAVCHPDDEALWVGGLITGLSRLATVRVVCLSGADPDSPRVKEFEAARATAGYAAGVIVGGPLRRANQPLPDLGAALDDGLRQLGAEKMDLLITHSPFGDEHKNPHHRQAHRQLRAWAQNHRVPFGYFSCLPIPAFVHTPLLAGLRRSDGLHLLNVSSCSPAAGRFSRFLSFRAFLEVPAYYLQFQTPAEEKRAMLACYRSINLPAHEAGYAAFSTHCESLYLMDERGYSVFSRIIEQMPFPGPPDLFDFRSPLQRVMAGAQWALSKWRRG